MPSEMRIAVIGAGATGLTAGYELSKKGHKVTIFEAQNTIGGLTSVINVGNTPLENIYHHIFTSDSYVTELTKELGIENKMIWREPTNGFYSSGKLYPFTSPVDLLKFSEIPFVYRISMGLLVLTSRFVKDFDALEKQSAAEWIAKMAGKPVYEKVWKPLLYSKFDVDAEKVAAVWIWNKFKLRGSTRGKSISKEMLGYMEGSFALIYDSLAKKIVENAGEVLLQTKVSKITRVNEKIELQINGEKTLFDKVLFTGAPTLLSDICGDISGEYGDKMKEIRYKSNICVMLQLKRSLSKYYWTTVADKEIPFVAVIEHTNIMPKELYDSNIVYLTRYLDESDPLFKAQDEEIKKTFCDGLKKMFVDFTNDDIINAHVYRSQYAQPIVIKEYSKIMPAFETHVEGLYLSSMAQIYPEDRGQNYAIRAGLEIAKIMND